MMVTKKIGAMVLSLSLMGWLALPQAVFSAETDGQEQNVPAEEVKKDVYTVAVLPFEASGDELKNVAPEVSQLMTTYLSGKEGISLVERDKLDKAISEMGLGISGTVDPQTAAQIGKIVGAKILISGRVFAVQSELFLVAKIIGTETSQVLAESVSLPVKNSYADATQQLADKVVATITAQGEVLVAEKKTEHDTLEDCLATLGAQRLFAFSTKAKTAYASIAYRRGDVFLFGSETAGLPAPLLARLPAEQQLRVPMREGNRSLNLSNAVAVVVYEAWRQYEFTGAV